MPPASANYKINAVASFFSLDIKFILTHQLRNDLWKIK